MFIHYVTSNVGFAISLEDIMTGGTKDDTRMISVYTYHVLYRHQLVSIEVIVLNTCNIHIYIHAARTVVRLELRAYTHTHTHI